MNTASFSLAGAFKGFKMELGLHRNSIGVTSGFEDVPLHSTWRGIYFVDNTTCAFMTSVLPLLKSCDKEEAVDDTRLVEFIADISWLLRHSSTIEIACADCIRFLNTLNLFFSSSAG